MMTSLCMRILPPSPCPIVHIMCDSVMTGIHCHSLNKFPIIQCSRGELVTAAAGCKHACADRVPLTGHMTGDAIQHSNFLCIVPIFMTSYTFIYISAQAH